MGGALQLTEYDRAWPDRLRVEAGRIRAALGPRAASIEHVGSTAVPGLFAKPVLDIAVAVPDEPRPTPASRRSSPWATSTAAGTVRTPAGGTTCATWRGAARCQIHLYVLPAGGWNEKLAFRDALSADQALARAYAAEKRRVADAVGWDKAAYSLAKGPFVERVLAGLRAAGRLAAVPPAS